MEKVLIDLIAGARPNFIKVAPIISELQKRACFGNELYYRLIHTGQHYDHSMSEHFFKQLGIPLPHINLKVGSGTQAEQAGNIMIRYERVLFKKKSDLCLVVGDVTSTMACSITARKLGVQVAHVEGGLRSGDWNMPEEINRVVTDSLTNWFFTTSKTAGENLNKEGINEDRIFFVGNTMIDTLLKQIDNFRPPEIWAKLNLHPGEFLVLTLHRPANVDEEMALINLLKVISKGAEGMPVIFPVHPRTAKVLDNMKLLEENLYFTEPLGYLEFNYLVKYSKGVITDSGGITEEATVMGVPCLTLRDNTERPETVTIGTNEVVGTDDANMSLALAKLIGGKWKKGSIPEKWDGKTSKRIVDHLIRILL